MTRRQPGEERRAIVAALGTALGAGILATLGSERTARAAGALAPWVMRVDSVGVLTASSAADLGAQLVLTEGYATCGDGGGGLFAWLDGPATPDGGTVVGPVGAGGAWHRLFDGPLQVEWFGAVHRGAASDHGAIQAACDALRPRGGVVRFGPHDYRVSGTVHVPSGVALVGAGLEATQIAVGNKNGMKAAFSWSPGSLAQNRGGALRDVWVYSDEDCHTLIALNGVAAFTMERCRLEGGKEGQDATARRGIAIRGGMDVAITSTTVNRCLDVGLYVDPTVLTTTLRCDRSAFRTTAHGPGAHVSGQSIHFESCTFESNGTVTTKGGCGVVVEQGTVTLASPYFEKNADTDIVAGTRRAAAGATLTDPESTFLFVTNPVFRSSNRASGPAIACGSVRGGAILGGDFTQVPGGSIALSDEAQGMLIAGCRTHLDPTRPGGLPGYGGLLCFAAQETGDAEISGKLGLRIGGGELLKRHRSFTRSLDCNLLPGSSVAVDALVPPGPTPAPVRFGDVVAVGYEAGGTGLPPHVLVSGSVTGNAPERVTVTIYNAGDVPQSLHGNLHIDVWCS